MSGLIGNEARYEADKAINVFTGRVVATDTGQAFLTTVIKRTVAAVFALLTVLYIVIGLWPAAILTLVGALALFLKRKIKPQIAGLWHGHCPYCQTEIWQHAPPKAENFKFACPACTQGVLLKDSAFGKQSDSHRAA